MTQKSNTYKTFSTIKDYCINNTNGRGLLSLQLDSENCTYKYSNSSQVKNVYPVIS